MFPRTLAGALANASRRQPPANPHVPSDVFRRAQQAFGIQPPEPPSIPPATPRNFGTAPDGTPINPIALKFVHPEQDRLDPGFRSILDGVSDRLGADLTITSGYRGPDHPVEARKPGGPGMHSTGRAADISMAGMDDATRTQLINELHGSGALRFGTYSGSPNMLHVDMKNQHGNNTPHFMFDRTAAKMGNAPGYFRTVAGDLSGQPVTPATMHGGPADTAEPKPQGLLAFLTGEADETKTTDTDKAKKTKTPGEAIADGLKAAAKGFGSVPRGSSRRAARPQATFVSAQAMPWVSPLRLG